MQYLVLEKLNSKSGVIDLNSQVDLTTNSNVFLQLLSLD